MKVKSVYCVKARLAEFLILDKHRIVSPLPVTIVKGKARIEGKKGLTYQVIIDGKRIVTIESGGIDEVDLNTPAREP